jgi:histone deacetylase 11
MIVVYHPKYLYGSAIINAMHPFCFDRAARVMALLQAELPEAMEQLVRQPEQAVVWEQLAGIHAADYLARARRSTVIARVVEVPLLFWCPRSWMHRWFVEPTLWCMAGTLLGARAALSEGLAYNVGGGLHHAKHRWGEGFCLFSDIALAILTLRTEGLLSEQDPITYIDLDVHQGNGVSTDFADDPAVQIMDMFNQEIYPFDDQVARAGIDLAIPLEPGTGDETYLSRLQEGLDRVFSERPLPRLVIYNAGTDVYKEDLLGGLALSLEGVRRRDMMVLEAVRGRGIPMLALASGGYSPESARMIANFVLDAYRWESAANRP